MDTTCRETQRAWEATPDDQALLAALIAARRRAGQPVPDALLRRRVFPARTLDLPFDARVQATLADGGTPEDGGEWEASTPSPEPLSVPAHRSLRVALFPDHDAALASAVEPLAREQVSGLRVWCARLSPSGLDPLARLQRLRDLTLEGMSSRPDAGLRVLERLPDLERLALREASRLTGRGLEPVGRMSNLVALELRHAQHVDDDALAWLPALRSMSSFELELSQAAPAVTDRTLRALAGLEHLERLGLSHSVEVTDAGVLALASATRLRRLGLELCGRVTDEGMAVLEHLPELRTLDLAGTLVGDETLRRVAAHASLEVLDVQGCDRITDEGLMALASSRLRALVLESTSVEGAGLAGLPPTLERLGLSGSAWGQELSGERLRALGRLTALRRVHLARLRGLSDVLDVLAPLPHLEEVTIREAPALGAAAVRALSRVRALRSLTLQECPGLRGASFDELARTGTLERLELVGVALDDAALRGIAAIRSLRRLELDVSNWWYPGETLAAFTDDGLRSLSELTDLVSLSLAGVPAGSRDAVEATLRAALPPACQVAVMGR